MKLLSVNLGVERAMPGVKETGKTGIYKLPVTSPVQVLALGLPGDVICDVKHHGGVDQAVYVYGAGDYAWWSRELGYEVQAGTFGENLTISELESGPVRIGDRFQIGTVILEATSPRIPCSTLAARMGDPSFVKRYHKAERPGLYCRVVQEGALQVGDEVTYQPTAGESLSALEMFRAYYDPNPSEEIIRRHLAAPVAIRARRDWEAKLQKLRGEAAI
jgi:MOSC domain-containing protein YiiM